MVISAINCSFQVFTDKEATYGRVVVVHHKDSAGTYHHSDKMTPNDARCLAAALRERADQADVENRNGR